MSKYIYSLETDQRVEITQETIKDFTNLFLFLFASCLACNNSSSIQDVNTPSVRALAERLGIYSADDLNKLYFY